MEAEKIRLRILALEDSMRRSSSKYYRRDIKKQIKKLKASLKMIEAERRQK